MASSVVIRSTASSGESRVTSSSISSGAAADADAAIDLSPNCAEAQNSRGIVYIYSGGPLAAVPYYRAGHAARSCDAAGRRELMDIDPKYSFVEHLGRLPFRNRLDANHLAEGPGKAGIAL